MNDIIKYMQMFLTTIKEYKGFDTYTPVPQSFWLILHSSEARFISSGHLWKRVVSQSDESDLCLSTIRSDLGSRTIRSRTIRSDLH